MEKEFSFDARVLMCQSCGAPLQTGFAGGEVTCGYCGTVNVFTPRKEEPEEPNASMRDIDENERLALLRRQDGSQPNVPPVIDQLLSGGKLAPWKEQEAFSMWRSTCSELARESDFSKAELLYFLTVLLSNYFSEKNDSLKQRAMYENALEVLTLPRHRQILRGLLARHAALEGDIEAAENWLAPCNPRSEDLETDSSYRVSKAEIYTVQGNWYGVLELLGKSSEDIPITAALDGKAIVQRANALERLGQFAEAVEELSLFLRVNGSFGSYALKMIADVYRNAGMEVCPVSIQQASGVHSVRIGRSQAGVENPGGCFGQVFALSGVLILISAFAVPAFISSRTGQSVIGAGISLGVMGLVFLSIGIHHVKKARRIIRVHAGGIEGSAIIESISPTGLLVNKVPQYSLNIQVNLPGKAPYNAKVNKTIPDYRQQQFHTGAEVFVKVDPKDRNNLIVMD